MTELEAVNVLLSVIGEAPVASLATQDVNEISDSALAQRTLNEVARDVQAEGWSWNQEQDWELVKSTDDRFRFPAETLRVEFSPTRYPDREYVRRGLLLYDKRDKTNQFPDLQGPVLVMSLVRQLPWEELPHTAQQYIVIRAARIYSSRFLNSDAIFNYTVGDEQYARAMMMRDEQESSKTNMLWDNQQGGSHGHGFLPREGNRYRRVFA